MYFNNTNNQGFRISACYASGRCGDYRRLYFNPVAEASHSIPSEQFKRPACLNVPKKTAIGQTIDISWCPPQQHGVQQYQLFDLNNQVVDISDTKISQQGVPTLSIPAPSSGTTYCYRIVALFDDDVGGYQYINQDSYHGCGKVDEANTKPSILPIPPQDQETVFSVSSVIASAEKRR